MFLVGAFLCAIGLNSFVAFEDGYRMDKTSNRVVLKGEGFGVRASSQSASRLQSYQIGMSGLWDVNGCWFVKGLGRFGLVFDGRYSEAGFLGNADGFTSDALAGVGRYFSLTSCSEVSPLVGWSYDSLNLTANHLTHPIDGVRTPVGNILFKSAFQGPWIGFDLHFEPAESMDLILGYELHHAKWNATRLLAQGELGNPPFGTTAGFSNVRSHNNLWGNVFGLNFMHQLSSGFIGFSMQYQAWQSNGYGIYKRTVTPLPPEITSSIVMNVEWESFLAMIQFGSTF